MNDKDKVNVTCVDCGCTFEVTYGKYRRYKNDHEWRCKSCRYKHHSDILKDQWNNRSDGDRKKISDARSDGLKEHWSKLSEDKRNEIFQKIGQSQKEKWNSLSPEEYKQRIQAFSEGHKREWESKSDEDRSNRIESLRNSFNEWYNNLTDEEKGEYHRKQNEFHSNNVLPINMKTRDENDSTLWRYKQPDEMVQVKCEHCGNPFEIKVSSISTRYRNGTPNLCRECMGKWISLSNAKRYQQMSDLDKRLHAQRTKYQLSVRTPEEWAEINKKNSEGLKRHWENVSDEENQRITDARVKGFHEWYNTLSDEEKSQRSKDRYASMSDENKQMFVDKMREYNDSVPYEEKLKRAGHMNEVLKTFTPEQKADMYKRSHQWYYNLDDLSREKVVRERLTASGGKNKFHEKFERAFSESHLVNSHHITAEYPTTNNGITHCWDYAVFDNETNSLQMLVDLDGAYFHADNCDYDGIHSKEEWDEKRALSIPNGINHCIIPELRFKDAFEFMLKMLMLDYDDYVAYVFRELRSQPFPYPSYSKIELLKSWEDLRRMKTDDKYHESISVNTRQGDRIIQHFHQSIWHDHRDGELSPYEAWKDDELLIKVIQNRIIYQTHLNPNKILQGFNIAKVAPKVSVFSAGRAKMIASRYLQDFNVVFDPFSGYSGRMLGVTSLGKTYIGQDISERHVAESNAMINFLKEYKVDIDATVTQKDIFKSSGEYPCLFTCSPYSTKEQWEEVPVDNRSCDDWIDVCLERFKCKRYIFVVDNTTKYTDYVVAEISNKSHFSNAKERIIVIDK